MERRKVQEDVSGARDAAGKVFVEQGAAIGGAAGGAAVGLAAANIAAASVATASSAAAAAAAAGGPFAAFATPIVTNPAAWAVALTNPVGAAVTVGGLTVVGAVAAYKVARAVLTEEESEE